MTTPMPPDARPASQEKESMRRYDLNTNYRCGSTIEEMERADDGEWVRYEAVEQEVAALKAQLTALEAEHVLLHEVAKRHGVPRWENRPLATGFEMMLKSQRATTDAVLARAEKELPDRCDLIARLAECYRWSGADPDGNEDWRLAEHAVEEVKRLREESDAENARLDAENAALKSQLTALEAKLKPPVEAAIEGEPPVLFKSWPDVFKEYVRMCRVNADHFAKWEAAEAEQRRLQQGWKELSAVLKMGGMDDPAFLIGAVQSQVRIINELKAEQEAAASALAMMLAKADEWLAEADRLEYRGRMSAAERNKEHASFLKTLVASMPIEAALPSGKEGR